MAEQLQAMMSMLGGGGGPAGVDGQPDMSQFFAQMMGQAPGSTPASNLLGDVDDPAGLGGAPPFPPDMSGFPGLGAMGGMPGMPGMGMPAPSAGKKWVERVFPVVHLLAMLALMAFAVVWWEPSLRSTRAFGQVDAGWGSRWGRLAGRKGTIGDLKSGLLGTVEVLVSGVFQRCALALIIQPLFYAFTTLELILQTTRFMIFKVGHLILRQWIKC